MESVSGLRSKLAAGALGGIDKIFIAPGAGVLYLGAASGTSINPVANIVGPVCLFAERGLTFLTDASLSLILHKRASCILLNFLPGRGMTRSTWPESARMSPVHLCSIPYPRHTV